MATTNATDERRTYGEWQSAGRQVKKGERRGSDGRFAFSQTKATGGRGGPRTCAGCRCRINYGVYCGKCEFGR